MKDYMRDPQDDFRRIENVATAKMIDDHPRDWPLDPLGPMAREIISLRERVDDLERRMDGVER